MDLALEELLPLVMNFWRLNEVLYCHFKHDVAYGVSTMANTIDLVYHNISLNQSFVQLAIDKRCHHHEVRQIQLSEDDLMLASLSKSEVILCRLQVRANPTFYRFIDLVGCTAVYIVPENQFIVVGDERGVFFKC